MNELESKNIIDKIFLYIQKIDFQCKENIHNLSIDFNTINNKFIDIYNSKKDYFSSKIVKNKFKISENYQNILNELEIKKKTNNFNFKNNNKIKKILSEIENISKNDIIYNNINRNNLITEVLESFNNYLNIIFNIIDYNLFENNYNSNSNFYLINQYLKYINDIGNLNNNNFYKVDEIMKPIEFPKHILNINNKFGEFEFPGYKNIEINSDLMYKLSDLNYFIGNINNGKKEIGTTLYNTKLYYKGFYDNNGVPEKIGRYIFPNGDFYEGNIIKGFPVGKGIYIKDNGNIYIGDFNNYNWKAGSCEEEVKSKYKFIGDYKNNKKNGLCKIYFTNNSVYRGNISNNYIEGEGEFVDNILKERYKGSFYDNNFNGKGTYYLKNGNYYEGEFIDGKANGYGILKNSKHEILKEGIFENNVLL